MTRQNKRFVGSACARAAMIAAMILGGLVASALTPAYSDDAPAPSLNAR